MKRLFICSDLNTVSDAYNDTEYVKNVFIQFITCSNPFTKIHMLKALCSALKMNAKETDALVKTYAKNIGIHS